MCESTTSDEMTSFEVLHNQNDLLESLDSSDFSIIPEQQPADEENEHLVNGSFDVNNMQSAFMSASQDLSVQEIQARILELVKDNAAMKEALEWNNVMMKEQLSTISAWHNQMTTSMSKQQLSLKEATEKVEELEKENAELIEKINHFEVNSKHITNTETCMDDDKKLHSNEDAESQIIKKIESQHCGNPEVSLQLKEAEDAVAELKLKMEQQDLELASLRKELKLKDCNAAVYESQQKENDALKCKCKNLETQLEECQVEEKKRKAMTDNKIRLLDNTMDKVRDLEKSLISEKQATEEERVKHAETKKLLNVLQSNYDRVTKLLEIQSKDQEEKVQHIFQERSDESKKCMEKIDNLMAHLYDKDEQLTDQEHKISDLTSKLQALSEDSESIPILKAQVDVYKMDLANALLVQDEAKSEVERLKKQLQEAQSGAHFCTHCGAGSSDGETTTRFKSRKKEFHFPAVPVLQNSFPKSPDRPSRQEFYVCPVCDFGFHDVQSLQNHVNSCLDKAR